MISKNIINCVLDSADVESKNFVIRMLLNYIANQYDGDKKIQHILDLMLDSEQFIEAEHINIDYIKNNLNLLMWKADEYNIKDIELVGVDNVDCVVIVAYKYLEKINEDRDDVTYTDSKANISFVDYPDIILRKC